MSNYFQQTRREAPKVTYDDKAWAQTTIVFRQSDPKFSAELFSRIAEEAAKRCSTAKNSNKPAQVRMLYDELTKWQSRVSAAGTDVKQEQEFQRILPYVKMLRARLAYALGRNNLIDQRFYDIFSTCIDKINDVESLNHCKLFFEAYIGFKKALDA